MKQSLLKISAAYGLLLCLATGCDSGIPTVSLGLDDIYYVNRMKKLPLSPALTGDAYLWKINGEIAGHDRNYLFLAAEEGDYQVSFDIIDDETPFHFDFVIRVFHEEVEYSSYISEVYEYCPAPGQFVNEMPFYEEGDTEADMVRKATECISGTNDVMISLGGWGGYVTFGFDHTVVNIPGQADFRIWGNSFYEAVTGARGGSAEPGIVMVSYDTNCNGLPDDPWYELAGSEYDSPKTRRSYSVTYERPDSTRQILEDETGLLTDIHYIRWTDNRGETGYIARNIYHDQDYFPRWTNRETLSFSGTCLAPNATDISGTGRYYILYAYDWGYVDNHPNDYADLNSFDISNAVDSLGNRVSLPGADFVRVYTGVNQYCGWLGETSTEITRAQDLHTAPVETLPDPIPD
ncbi:MAG: hypothetical protein NC336_07270 [Clostridium sp.]|nr:hypothetical protein [Clostridium sp.]